ncbi:MAG: pyridoxamine 5'-phosphate oxidase family protein [Candidatus Tenebribacter burtonii]|jgi:nitroimidazol reductase NimA-like FMN-containing flavoprotein (pyridoxamine 5'-phosphate oxidase superfamily)|nr:pyridoxamine 5'-phosphate oxidase family protein [Candidatus Tenebribacter burtonii]
MLDIITKTQVCYLGMSKGNLPYVLPINFGFHDNTIYFHCALKGEKIEILKDNPNICLVFNIDNKLINNVPQDDWSIYYKSVIVYGKIQFIKDITEKQEAINIMFRHYEGINYTLPKTVLERTMFMKVKIEKMTGKQNILHD